MGNLSLIFIFVVVCLLGTASTLNTTKTIDLYSPAATGVESRQFYNGNNLQLHWPNMIDQFIMFITRVLEFVGVLSTETATAITTTTTTTTATTQKLTCELLGGMTCAALTTTPNCITLADAGAADTDPNTWASTCAQTGSGMGVVFNDGLDATTAPSLDVLRCLFGVATLMDDDVININLDGTDCKTITTAEEEGNTNDAVAEATSPCDPGPFVCAVAVPP